MWRKRKQKGNTFLRLRSWIGLSSCVFPLSTSMDARSSTEISKVKTCSWLQATRSSLVTLEFQKCWRTQMTRHLQFRAPLTTCHQKCANLNPTPILPTCGRSAVSYTSSALWNTRSPRRIFSASSSKLSKTNKSLSATCTHKKWKILSTCFSTKTNTSALKWSISCGSSSSKSTWNSLLRVRVRLTWTPI